MNKLYWNGIDIENYGFILKSCSVTEPEPQTNYVEIPGRNGELDLTELFGSIAYNDRDVNITLININGQVQAQAQLKKLIRDLQGQSKNFTHRISRDGVLYIDKMYNGRLYVTDWSYNDNIIEVNIEGKAKPNITVQTCTFNKSILYKKMALWDKWNPLTYGASNIASVKIYGKTVDDSVPAVSIGNVDGALKKFTFDSSGSWLDVTSYSTSGATQDTENNKYITLATDNYVVNQTEVETQFIISVTWTENY